MAKKKRMKAEERKPQILKHFYEVLMEEGIEKVSIGKVANHMGVHKSLLVHYFNTKDQMFVELIGMIVDQYSQTFRQKIKEIDDPERRLNEAIDIMFGAPFFGLPSTKPDDDETFYACYYLTYRNEAIRKRLQEMYIFIRNELTDIIKGAMEAGIIHMTDPVRAADLLLVLFEGSNTYGIIRENDRQTEDFRNYIKEKAIELLTTGKMSI